MKKMMMMMMILLSVSGLLIAQQSEKRKEAGICFTSLNSFGFNYKTGTSKALWRFNTLSIRGYNTTSKADSVEQKVRSNGIEIKIGREYRRPLSKNMEFRMGADLSFTYSYSKSEYDDKTMINYDMKNESRIYSPGINLVLGLNYAFNEHFILGAEIMPGFSYNTGNSSEKRYYLNSGDEIKSKISGYNIGLSNSSLLLTLAHRF